MALGRSCNFNRHSRGPSIAAQGKQEKDGHARSLEVMSAPRAVMVGRFSFIPTNTAPFTFRSQKEEKGRGEGYEEVDRQEGERRRGTEEGGDTVRYSGNVKIVNSFLGRGPKKPFFFQNKIAKEK